MLPFATLPSAGDLRVGVGSVPVAVSADEGAGDGSAVPAVRLRGQVRADRRRAPLRDAAASLETVSGLGCVWRGADGTVTVGAVPGNGTVVIGAAAGAYAPGIDVKNLAARAVHAQAEAGVTGGAGAGLLSAVFTAGRIGVALSAAGVPARAVRKTSPALTAQVLLAAPFHRDKPMAAVWRHLTARGRETDPGYDPPARSSISDATHYLGVKVPAFALAAVIGTPPPPGPGGNRDTPGDPGGAAGPRGMSGPVTCADDRGWSGGRWHGHRVKATDGTHFALPGAADTSVNWRHFGSAAGSRPLAQAVAVTDVWHRTLDAVALGKDSASEHELARHLLPAFGPGMISLADRGFPSHRAAFEMRDAGAHFVWRMSSSWNLTPCGKPLADGSYLTKLTWHGKTMKVRVIEFHIDVLATVPAGCPLLASPPAGIAVTVTGQATPAGLVTVHVSENFTLITSLRDTAAYPAGDIAALYGDRWTIELAYYELKVTVLGAGTACRSPHPGGVYPEILYALCGQHAMRLLGAHYAAALNIPAGRISAAALRAEIITSAGAGHGDPALLPAALTALRTDITRHPARWIVPHRPGRHYPRYTIKKIRSRKTGDIVPGRTSVHLLPLATGDITAGPCATCPPAQPAPAEVTPRPG